MKIDGIRLLVNDFDKCFEFYSETLGLTASWGKKGEDYASFDIGLPSCLSLFKSDLMAASIGNSDKSLPSDSREKFVITLRVDDIHKTYKEFSDRGAVFLTEPTDMPGWGITVAHLRDPEGNLIEILTELAMDKWDKDLQEAAKQQAE
ncbi:MAG: VOC family protein [Hyphomicrobiales bacterium]